MSEIDFENVGFGTLAIHAGQEPDKLYGALATPIYQTSTFCFDTVEEGTAKFAGEIPGFCYSRGGNPTTVALEKKIAMLEGGEACISTASGMGAVGGVMLGLLKAGDHVICGECVYGCTDVVLRTTLQKFGVEVTYADTTDLESVKTAIKDNTKLIYFETLTNPTMELTDIAGISKLAHEKGVLVAVDNTFTPPPEVYPLKEGADIVLHSCTKYINGHGDVISGAIIGSSELITPIRKGVTSKICGTTPSPFNSFLLLRGLALGLLAQLVYNEKEDQVEELKQLMTKFHMPCSLADIGLSINDENFDKLYQRLCTFPFMTHDRKHEELLKEAINSLGGWKNDIKGNE